MDSLPLLPVPRELETHELKLRVRFIGVAADETAAVASALTKPGRSRLRYSQNRCQRIGPSRAIEVSEVSPRRVLSLGPESSALRLTGQKIGTR